MAVWKKDIEDSDHLIWRRLFPLLQGQGHRRYPNCVKRCGDSRTMVALSGVAMLAIPQRRGSLLPLLARLRLQGVGPTSDLWQGRLDVPLVEDARQVRGVRPD